MKILIISPPTFGKHSGAAAKDTFGITELVQSMGHEVVFYAIGNRGQDQALIDDFSVQYKIPVHIFMPVLDNWLQWFSYFLFKSPAYLDRASYVFGQLVVDPTFNDFLASWRPDRIIFFCSYGWPVAHHASQKGIPSILRSHNYEPDFFFESLTKFQRFLPSNWIRYGAKILSERNAVLKSSAVATLPFDGMRKYRRLKQSGIFIFTLTFPWRFLRDSWVHMKKKPLDIFYLGASYAVSFHLRGARALITEIAPEVLKSDPGVFRFHICGAKLPQDLRDKCDGINIIYEDYVHDFEMFMDKMDIGVFPVWTGKVMKGKVFESICRAFPVVIPRNCLGGYDLKDMREASIAETPKEFVAAILMLRDEHLRLMLSEGAAEFGRKNFSKEALSYELARIFSSTQR